MTTREKLIIAVLCLAVFACAVCVGVLYFSLEVANDASTTISDCLYAEQTKVAQGNGGDNPYERCFVVK